MKKALIAAMAAALAITSIVAPAAAGGRAHDKVWVCKYVTKPGGNEIVKYGNDGLVWVNASATLHDLGDTSEVEFNDRHILSVVVAVGGREARPAEGACYQEPPEPPKPPEPPNNPPKPPNNPPVVTGAISASGYICGDPRFHLRTKSTWPTRKAISVRFVSAKTKHVKVMTRWARPGTKFYHPFWVKGKTWVVVRDFTGKVILKVWTGHKANTGPC